MRIDQLDYHLPEASIAQEPATARDGARLLVLDADTRRDAAVVDLPAAIPEHALIVLNDTRVVPARLLGNKHSGGRVEIFLVRRGADDPRGETWVALGRSSKPLAPGVVVLFGDGLTAEVLEKADDGVLRVLLRAGAEGVASALEREGHMPLPPYITRPDAPVDRERYQTVFARVPGAVAAPTAGLHLSAELLERLRARGASTASITLHVGLGTFRPVAVDDLDDHPMHAEELEISAETAATIEAARADGRPIVAVGTTVVRALESSAARGEGRVVPFRGETSLLIQPGYRFQIVDALFTNFHLPKSTLLALVAAFAGRSRVLSAYEYAVRAGYRFFSYGDAMFLRSRIAPEEAAR